jgi:hypothetical protein
MKLASLLLGVLILGTIGVSSCDKGTKTMSSKPSDTLPALASELGIVFPPSTRLIGVQRDQGGMDSAVFLKVEMAAAEFPAFLASTPLDASAMRNGTRGFLGSDQGFWDPHRASRIRTGQAILAGNRALNVGVDDSKPHVAVVYIVHHDT